MVTTAVVHIIGVLYKIPLTAVIGPVGRGYFTSAYEFYTPIYALAMAGLPIAVSRMVAERMATGRYREVRKIQVVVRKIFLVTGIVGTLLLFALAYPYTHLKIFIDTPEAMWAIFAIAPSVFFCCMMSVYRGYYEGLRNMKPTGTSQIIETLGKLIFGLIIAKMVVNAGNEDFKETGIVFGHAVKTAAEADSVIAPFAAAGAISGVTLGTVCALFYLMILHKIKGDGITQAELDASPAPDTGKNIAKALISLAIPVVLSSMVLNLTNFIDSWTIQNRLVYVVAHYPDIIKDMYHPQFAQSHVLDKDIKGYLYGSYGVALDFKNIIPTITMTLGISALPALSGAWALKNKKKINSTIESVLRTAMFITVPCGVGLAVLAEPILRMFYNGTSTAQSIPIIVPIVAAYGISATLLSLSTPLSNMLQAVGRADYPVKSLLVGAVIKIACNYTLVGNPNININGAPFGTIACYAYIVCANLYVLLKETGCRPSFISVFLKPLFAGLLGGGSSYGFYKLFMLIIPAGNIAGRVNGSMWSVLLAIPFSVLFYCICLVFLRVLNKDDLLMMPKGEKIVKILEKHRLLG